MSDNRVLGVEITLSINVRKNRKGNQEWTIKRNWQHLVHQTKGEGKQNKKTQYDKCWTPLYTNKQAQIT